MIVRSIVPLCDRMHLSLFQLFHVPALAKYAVACERAPLTKPQCVFAIDRNLVAIERKCIYCYIFAYLRMCDRSYVPALERTSAGSTNRLEAVYVSVFIFYFFVCLIISFSLIIYCLCMFYLFIY